MTHTTKVMRSRPFPGEDYISQKEKKTRNKKQQTNTNKCMHTTHDNSIRIQNRGGTSRVTSGESICMVKCHEQRKTRNIELLKSGPKCRN